MYRRAEEVVGDLLAGIEEPDDTFLATKVWTRGHEAVTCPIPATSDPGHMRDNIRSGYGRLPEEEMRRRMVAEMGA